MRFYTNATTIGDFVFERYIDEKGRHIKKTKYQPTIYFDSEKSKHTHQTLLGDYVVASKKESIKEARESVKFYKGSNLKVYGHDIGWSYCYLSEEYPEKLEYDENKIRIFFFDIETEVSDGFPHPAEASQRINVISIFDSLTQETRVWTLYENDSEELSKAIKKYCKDNSVDIPGKLIVNCFNDNEKEMLLRFVAYWKENFPDIATGWNIEGFDVPYIVNRLIRLFGEDFPKHLSPYEKLRTKTVTVFGEDEEIFVFEGIALIDYIPLYKKITMKNHESFKLDFIANYYLGKGKLEYEGSFRDFYTNEFPKFVAYNVIDVLLVREIDNIINCFSTTIGVSYLAKINYEDVFSPVKTWDIMIYNYLKNKNIVVPPKQHNTRPRFEGAYVRDPRVGFHKWVLSFDVNSMYPHIIMGWNMSPEKIREGQRRDISVETVLSGRFDYDTIDDNIALAANGAEFDNREFGVLPELTSILYEGRSADKKLSGEAKKKVKELTSQLETNNDSKELRDQISEWKRISISKNVEQNAKKVLLNSLFGATGNEGFRYFDLRIAEGITTTGQLIIRWAGDKLDEMFRGLSGENVVIYQDTDSIYISLESFVNKFIPELTDTDKIVEFLDKFAQRKIEPFLESVFEDISSKMGCASNYIHMKREAIATTGIWLSKKRYLLNLMDLEGYRYETPELKMLGVDAVKSSTPKLVRDALSKTFPIILSGDKISTESFINSFRDEFYSADISEVAFPRSVNNLQKYQDPVTIVRQDVTVPIHVRATLMYNYLIDKHKLDQNTYRKIPSGSKIKYCYLRKQNPSKQHVIGFESHLPVEFGLHKFIDYDTQFEKTYIASVMNVLEAIGWEDILSDTNSIF